MTTACPATRLAAMSRQQAIFLSPEGTSRWAFVSALWPVILIYLAGPAGNLISGGGWNAGPGYLMIVATDFSIFLAVFSLGALWAYEPVATIIKRWSPGLIARPKLLQIAVSRLPYRVAMAYLLIGVLFSSYIVLTMIPHDSGPMKDSTMRLFIATAAMSYFAFTLVVTALAVARTLVFTVQLRKRLSHAGIFTDKLGEAKKRDVITSVSKRPWLLFLLTSIIPIALMALFFFLGQGLPDPRDQQIIFAQMTILFFGVFIIGSYLVYTMSQLLKMVFAELEQGVQSIRSGKFDNRVAILSDDETGMMAQSLNTAMEGLRERADMKDSLDIASEIQEGLLPVTIPEIHGYSLAAIQQSCYEVGGDYYDFIELPDGHLWIVVADVSGKGYPAALTVSNLHAMLNTLSSSGHAFGQIAAFMNQALYRVMKRGQFVTTFIAEINPDSSRLRWMNAGHPPAILVTQSGTLLLEAKGPPLGLLPELILEVNEQKMCAGDLLAIFSDGLTDMRCRRDNEELYGMSRVEAWIRQQRPTEITTLPGLLMRDLKRFGEPARDDDLTVLFLHRDG